MGEYRLADPEHSFKSDLHYQQLIDLDPALGMQGAGRKDVELIYALHELQGTEPDWEAMGKRDLGFTVGLLKSLGKQAKDAVEGVGVLVDGVLIHLPIALVQGISNLVKDPQGTIENIITNIQVLPAYIEHAPDNFKAYLDNLHALEDPYEQGETLGKLVGNVSPTAVLAGGTLGRALKGVKKAAQGFKKVGRGAKVAKRTGDTTKALKQALPNKDVFLRSAEATWKNDAKGTLSVAGRALQKHAGRAGSAFSDIKFSGKTANQDAMKVIKEILNSKNQVVEVAPRGGYEIYDPIAKRGFSVSHNGLFNGFRNYKEK